MVKNLQNVVKVAQNYNLPLRITEAATLSYGGVMVRRARSVLVGYCCCC